MLAMTLAFVIYLWLALKLREAIVDVQSATGGLQDSGAEAMGKQLMEGVVGWFVDLESGTFSEMLAGHSPFALVFFLVALAVNPLVSILATFDQTGGDISTRHIRYLLLRTNRRTLYWGKVLGATLFVSLILGVLVAIVAGFGILGGATPASEILYFVRIWLTLSVSAIPFIALNAWANALAGSAGGAFGITFGYYATVWLISAVGGWVDDTVKMVGYLSPSALKFSLAADDLAIVGKGLVHMGIIAAIGLALGSLMFQRRDV